jgi:hypothetical protein
MRAAVEIRVERLLPLVAGLLLLAGVLRADAAAADPVPNPDPSLISVWQPCEPETGVTVIVDFQSLGAHDVQVRCAPGEPGTGVSALVNAGFTVAGAEPWGLSFICRIDDLPTTAEQLCNRTPGDSEYWSYWHGRPGGQWSYSGYFPEIGTVEGWGFSRLADPGVPYIRIRPQDGRGITLQLPDTYPSSAIQLRLAQDWLARRLRALAPAGGGASVNDTGKIVSYAAALGRSGYSLTGSRFQGAREFLAKAATAGGYAGFGSNPPRPHPEPLGAYAIALAALRGGEPLLDDGTNMRRWLLEDIEAGSGKVLDGADVFGGEVRAVEDGPEGGAVLEALARTGTLPTRATALIEMIERTQEASGSFTGGPEGDVPAMRGLAAAREAGAAGLAEPIAKLTAWVAGLQESDGAVRFGADPGAKPTFASTAAGALILGLGGEDEAATKAAQWLSPFQVTAELAGEGPGSADVGGFAKSLETLTEAIDYGANPGTGIEVNTPAAAEALTVAPWLNPVAATASTASALNIGSEGATVIGAVNTGTSDRSVSVEYGPTTAYGSTATGPSLVAAMGQTPVEVGLTGLQPATTYHFRLVATGPGAEAVHGGDATFTTMEAPAEPAIPPAPRPDSSAGGATPPPASIRAVAGEQAVGHDGVARLATLTCPAGSSCAVTVPARVKVKIAGKGFWAKVLAPTSLAAGSGTPLRLRLPPSALRALAGSATTVVVPVALSNAGGRQALRVKVKLTSPSRR